MANTRYFINSITIIMSRIVCTLLILTLVCSLSIVPRASAANTVWINHGKDLFNTRHAAHEPLINASSVVHMKFKWKFVTGDDVSATPAVYGRRVYFPSWNGNLYAVRAASGRLVWMQNLTQLTGILYGDHQRGENTTLSRSTPTIAGEHNEMLIIGLYGPADVIAVRRSNGALLWHKRLDSAYLSVITMSGTYYQGGFYVGTSSVEENFNESCCSFQGSFLRMDAITGHIVWRTRMLPDNKGRKDLYSGAPIWGSSPSIDPIRRLVFIATGNVYTVPQRIMECRIKLGNQTSGEYSKDCIEPDNHLESVLALDLRTGHIKWATQLGGFDSWVAACPEHVLNSTCGPDYDFSDCPALLTIKYDNGTLQDVAVAAQKNGKLIAVDRDTGAVVWSKFTGPDLQGPIPQGEGGQIWGTATDGKTIYANVANWRHKNWTLAPQMMNTTTGGWTAVSASTGAILWSTSNPTGVHAIGPTSLANSNVVFGTSMDPNGSVFALDAQSGAVLWNATTDATVFGGCAISHGCIFVGSGASTNVGKNYNGTHGTSLYAFCIPR